jgi:protein SERAC1
MDITSLIPMVEDGPTRFLLESIGNINSQIISIQTREFHNALGREGESGVVYFYETVMSPIAARVNYANRLSVHHSC